MRFSFTVEEQYQNVDVNSFPGFYDQYREQSNPHQHLGKGSPPPTMAQSWSAPAGSLPPNASLAFANSQQDRYGSQKAQPTWGNNAQPVSANPPMNARIVIELDGKVIGEHPLNKPLLTVGRLSGNDIQVPSKRVSRLHAKIRWEDGMWLIEDVESLNGLIYKGKRIDRLPLSNGDRIYLAPTAVIQYKTTP